MTAGAPRPRDERGVVLALLPLLTVVLFTFVALVVDVGAAQQTANQAQSAADAGALAGAQNLPTAYGWTAGAPPTAVTNAARYAAATMSSTAASPSSCTPPTCAFDANGATIVVTSPYPTVADVTGTTSVHVEVCRKVPASFAGVVGITSFTPCRQATATRQAASFAGASILVLNGTEPQTLKCSGSCNIDVGDGSLVVNSTNLGAADVSGGVGSVAVTAGRMDANLNNHTGLVTIGGVVIDYSCRSPDNPCPTTHEQSVDPYAGVAVPAPPSPTYTSDADCKASGTHLRFRPGTYDCTLTISATAGVTFDPGIYYLENGFTMSGSNATASGAGVLFYNAANKFTISGGARADFTPPSSGPYADILIFQGRTNTNKVTLSGGSALNLPGAIYNPVGSTELSGGSSTADASGIGRIVTDKLVVSGPSRVGRGSSGGGGMAPERIALVPDR